MTQLEDNFNNHISTQFLHPCNFTDIEQNKVFKLE